MKQSLLKKLLISLMVTVAFLVCIFVALMNYNQSKTDEAAIELGMVYMEEMMLQMQDHFSSVIDMKNKEVNHIANWTKNIEGYRETLKTSAQSMGFEYVALYDADGKSESILGESAWFRHTEEYLAKIAAEEQAVTTGYLTETGDKYIVFGTPAEFTMQSGKKSSIMLAGFSVKKLYDYINLDAVEQLGSKVNVWIISTNGSYILKAKPITEESLFDRLNNWGSFVGIDEDDAIPQIEKAMAGRKSFSHMVSIDGTVKHIFGAPAGEPEDWYFMITMPRGISDEIIMNQRSDITKAFSIAGIIVFVMLCCVFFLYYCISAQQRKELENAWKDAEKSRNIAENANMAKTFFLSNMSHDIRTPMNAIIGFTNIAMKETDLSSVHNYLKKISVSSNHLLLLINEILEMSRIESGKIVLDETPCSLSDLLDNLHTVLNKKADEKKLTFTIHGDIQNSYIYGDKRRLGQILINLTDNAIKYTAKNGTVAVELKQIPCKKDGFGSYEIIVSDNGIGMSEEFVQKIFEPFERENTSTVSGIEGTGLGLSIVHHFVNMMNGEILVESQKGEGTVFTVKVCLRLLEADKINQFKDFERNTDMESIYNEVAAQQFFNGKRILLVDDNAFNREIAQTILEDVGFEVETAENGEIAVQKVKNSTPDYYSFILMDVQMPIMDGYEATKEIRSLDTEHSKIKIIAVTANAFESDKKKALDVGMDSYIPKPIDTKVLYRVLKSIN